MALIGMVKIDREGPVPCDVRSLAARTLLVALVRGGRILSNKSGSAAQRRRHRIPDYSSIGQPCIFNLGS